MSDKKKPTAPNKKKPSLADLIKGMGNAKKTAEDRLFEKNVNGSLTGRRPRSGDSRGGDYWGLDIYDDLY